MLRDTQLGVRKPVFNLSSIHAASCSLALEMFLNTFVTYTIHCYIFCKITEMSFNCLALARFQGSIPLGGDALTFKSAFSKLPTLGTFPLVSSSPRFAVSSYLTLGKLQASSQSSHFPAGDLTLSGRHRHAGSCALV